MNIEKPVRITRTYTQRIEAQPDEVFPLLCPVMTHHSEEEFHRAMAWWEKSMNHYIKTGERLRKG